MQARFAALVAILIIIISAARARAQDLSYTLDLAVDPESGELRGGGEIALVNSSALPLDKVPLVLYPNRFRAVDPAITDVNFTRYYKWRFHPGEIRIESIVGKGGVPLDLVAPDVPGMPSGTYVEVKLAELVPPGGTARIGIRFVTKVPERFGPFGKRDDRVIVEGGAWPLVPSRGPSGAFEPALGPMVARHDVSVTSTKGEAIAGGAPQAKRARDVARTLFVGAGDDLEVIARSPARAETNSPEVVYRGPKGSEERAQRVVALVREAAQLFRRDWAPGAPIEPVVVVEAPLRDRLVLASTVLLASDRLWEVLPLLDDLHEREVTRGTFEVLARRLLSREGGDAAWLAEAIAWVATDDWDKARRALTGRDVRKTLGYFDFIQFIDTQLRAPQFAGSDLYFGSLWEPRDAVKDELERFGSSRPRGRILAEKLRDRFGDAKLRELARRSLAAGDGCAVRERASKLAQEDLAGFFDLWLGAPPEENLLIAERGDATLNGERGLAVTVQRDTKDARIGKVGEPVTVQVDSGGKKERIRWDGKGDGAVLVFPRHGFVYSVDVDPDGRIEEGDKGDNGWPNYAKVLVNRFGVSADFNGGNTSSIDVGLTIRPFYDYSQAIRAFAFYSPTSGGVSGGYSKFFGLSINEVTFGQGVGFDVSYSHLQPGLVRDANIEESRGHLVAYSIGYAFGNRVTDIKPTHGFGLAVGLESSYGPWFGGDFEYEKATGGATWVFSPVRPISFAFRVSAGHVVGDKIASQVLFDCGGEDGVRGVRTGDFVNRGLLVLKSEVRVSVLEDLDVNVAYLGWVRRVELAAFCDAGDVFPGLDDSLRAPARWKVGVGGGIRVEVDAFGARPVVIRADVGFRVDDQPGGSDRARPQLYLGVNQPF